MTCREVTEFIMHYLEGELPAAQREEFARHLAACPPCVRYIDTYKATIAAAKSLAGESADKVRDIPEALVKAILAARQK